MLTFHAAGDWLPDQVRVDQVRGARRIVPEVEKLIDQAWQTALARPGVKLFDGPMCRLERWEVAAGRFQLELSDTSYRTFVGTNLTHPEMAEQYGPDVMANPVGLSPALLTADGFLLLGRRNASVAYYPNRIHPFAGSLEPRDSGDVFGAVRRELAEELSLGESDITEIRCTGMAEDRALRQPELLFHAQTFLTRRQIESQVDLGEHHGSVAVPATPAAVEKFTDDPELTPIAVASLFLWGRVAFGDEWFGRLAAGVRHVASPQ
jgi:8-oxo-dGTP pyrophosphatase MutT (NUDIX family)